MLNFCHPGGYTAGVKQDVPEETWCYNWGRSDIGCNNLECRSCAQKVRWTLTKGKRLYQCACESYAYDELDCLGIERYEGPMDYPAQRPNWACAGHPLRPLEDPEPPQVTTFHDLDQLYNSWKGTPRAQQVALRFSKVAGKHKGDCALFYLLNPGAPGREAMLRLKPTARVARGWCQALAANTDDPRFRDGLRSLALTPAFSRYAVATMETDREWLSGHVEELLALEPGNGEQLCSMLARDGYGWDKVALSTLPLELLRARAGITGRSQLYPDEAEVYWERDYPWLLDNYARLQEKESDFGFYIQDFLSKKGWQPDLATRAVWKAQALRMNESYNAIRHLARWDRSWVEENLGLILDSSPIRGVWVVDQLRQAGSENVPQLLEVVRQRTPDDCKL